MKSELQTGSEQKDPAYPAFTGLHGDMVQSSGAHPKITWNDEHFRKIYDAITDRLMVVDRNFRIVSYNRTAGQKYGNNLEGRLCYEVFRNSRESCPDCAVKKTFDTKKPSYTFHSPTKAEIYSYPVFDDRDNVIAVLEHVKDVTDKLKIEQSFRESEEKRKTAEEFIRNVLETVDEGFIVIDREFKILSANKAYCSQVGIGSDQVVGRKCHEVSHGAGRPCFEENHPCAVKRTFETEGSHTEIHVHRNKHGESIYVETKSFPLRDSTGKVTAAIEIVNNISEKKKLEEQLLHSQKMEAIGLLAGGIAHDFNNILSAIIGYTSLIQAKVSGNAQLSNYTSEVLASANRAANLTQSLLAFSRKQVIDPKPLSLNTVIAKIEKLLMRVIGEDIEFRTSYADKELTVLADRGQLEQLLLNLATNARDAMPGGGTLKITTEKFSMNEGFLGTHRFGKAGEYAVIHTADSGTGMDEATRERIFEPFFTTKESGKGTGLGLSIVYGIVKQNGGYIECVSEPGKGTTFSCYLPLIDESSGDDIPATMLSARRGSETILIAEDDESLRKLGCSVLERHGYRVIVARDGDEAIRLFKERKDEIKLLLFDVIMPKKNGKEAYEEIRALAPHIKALFTSGYTADVVSNRGIMELGRFFISKPVSPTALLLKVREVLDSDA